MHNLTNHSPRFYQNGNAKSHDDELSLEECKKILNQDGFEYTDEEVLVIRDWLYQFADMTLEDFEEGIISSKSISK